MPDDSKDLGFTGVISSYDDSDDHINKEDIKGKSRGQREIKLEDTPIGRNLLKVRNGNIKATRRSLVLLVVLGPKR